MKYKEGDLFKYKNKYVNEIFMLCQVGMEKWCLIGIDGNRWTEAVEIFFDKGGYMNIPNDSKLWGDRTDFDNWRFLKDAELVCVEKPNRPKIDREHRRITL
jgi:hypothetical protein